MLDREELIAVLHNQYHEDLTELNDLDTKELEEILFEITNHEDLFPNGDEDDDSYSWE